MPVRVRPLVPANNPASFDAPQKPLTTQGLFFLLIQSFYCQLAVYVKYLERLPCMETPLDFQHTNIYIIALFLRLPFVGNRNK